MDNAFIGLVIGQRYEIKKQLGIGQAGIVFEAYDQDLCRPVAVKIVKPEHARSDDIINALIKEAHIIAQLEHPNILSIYGQGTQDVEGQRLVYLVTQLASGGTLADRLKTGALPPGKVERILEKVCNAMDYAHHREVLHLDLKPLNILFDEHGRPFVADFGLARLLQGASRIKANTFFGTPAYMPPEQFLGLDAGPFSDIYALGITLYQMFTGELPKRDLIPPFFLPNLDYPLPPQVQAVIERATRPDPNQRYRTAGELAQAFTAAITPSTYVPPAEDAGEDEDKSIPSLPLETKDGPIVSQSSPSKKSWISRVGIGLAVLAIVAILTWLGRLWQYVQQSEQTEKTLAALSLTLAASPSVTAVPTATPPSSPTAAPSPTTAPTPTPSPTPYLDVRIEQLFVYAGPGENYDVWGELHRGDRLPLCGRSTDGTWWQVDYFGRKGWVRAQAIGANVAPRVLPGAESPPTPTEAPTPTKAPTPTIFGPNTTLRLQNPGFEGIQENLVFGWRLWAEDNFEDKEDYNPDTTYDTPLFRPADDPNGIINGATLQIDAAAFLKYRVHVYQTVNVVPAVTVRFQALAKAHSSEGSINLAAGIDPDGGPDCSQAQWGDVIAMNQSSGTVRLVAPDVTTGQDGAVTVCLYAETTFSAYRNTAFFDSAALIANPE